MPSPEGMCEGGERRGADFEGCCSSWGLRVEGVRAFGELKVFWVLAFRIPGYCVTALGLKV